MVENKQGLFYIDLKSLFILIIQFLSSMISIHIIDHI